MGVAGPERASWCRARLRADLDFVEGDFHSRESIAKMSAGIPLSDEDRAGWLRALASRLATPKRPVPVVASSALKRSYRDVLRGGAKDIRFIYLKGPRPLIAQRLTTRGGHFMRASMLDSQFSALEEPAADEQAWVVDITRPPQEIVADLITLTSA